MGIVPLSATHPATGRVVNFGSGIFEFVMLTTGTPDDKTTVAGLKRSMNAEDSSEVLTLAPTVSALVLMSSRSDGDLVLATIQRGGQPLTGLALQALDGAVIDAELVTGAAMAGDQFQHGGLTLAGVVDPLIELAHLVGGALGGAEQRPAGLEVFAALHPLALATLSLGGLLVALGAQVGDLALDHAQAVAQAGVGARGAHGVPFLGVCSASTTTTISAAFGLRSRRVVTSSS